MFVRILRNLKNSRKYPRDLRSCCSAVYYLYYTCTLMDIINYVANLSRKVESFNGKMKINNNSNKLQFIHESSLQDAHSEVQHNKEHFLSLNVSAFPLLLNLFHLSLVYFMMSL